MSFCKDMFERVVLIRKSRLSYIWLAFNLLKKISSYKMIVIVTSPLSHGSRDDPETTIRVDTGYVPPKGIVFKGPGMIRRLKEKSSGLRTSFLRPVFSYKPSIRVKRCDRG